MSTTVRRAAPRPARPAARYWKGKAPKGAEEAASESDEDESPLPEEEGDVPVGGEQDIVDEDEDVDLPVKVESGKALKAMNVSLKDVNISKDGKVIVAGRDESGRTALEEESEEDESEEDELPHRDKDQDAEITESSESDSEEEEQPKLLFRPVFVPKRGRVTITEKESITQDSEEVLKQKEVAAEARRKQSHDLVAESIRRELAEKEKEDLIPEIDDADGLDPTAEFEAWRLRELGRIKKEKEDEVRIEEEREEVERRRALPEEQRLKEDMERANKLRAEKPKGQQKFLQKYWHKGAFHQDEEILRKHDFTEGTESTVDISLLPKVMQVRNFGKRSRTKYTHLVDQDTTAGNGGFGGSASVKAGGKSTDDGGCFLCGGPHLKKDCPQNVVPAGRGPVSGANTAPSAPRQWCAARSWRDDPRDAKPRNDDRDGKYTGRRDYPSERHSKRYDSYDARSSRRRSRSRSGSPYRGKDRDSYGRRPVRENSQERATAYRDKRRRLD